MDKTLKEKFYLALVYNPYEKDPNLQTKIDSEALDFLSESIDKILYFSFGFTYTVEDATERINKENGIPLEIKKYMVGAGTKGTVNRILLSKFMFFSNRFIAFYFGAYEYIATEFLEISSDRAVRRNKKSPKITKEDIQHVISSDVEIKELSTSADLYYEKHKSATEIKSSLEICKDLHLFYNCNSLSLASKRLQHVYLEAASKGSSTLTTLIKNYFMNRYKASKGISRNPTPKYIDGPMSLSYHTSDYYNKRIYIFGESHGDSNNCRDLGVPRSQNIIDFFKQIFKTTDKFIDFYLEYPAYATSKTVNRYGSGYLADMLKEFSVCIDPKKRERECKWKTARLHFADIRTMDILESPEYKIDIMKIMSKVDMMRNIIVGKNEWEIINFLTQSIFNFDVFFKELWKQISNHKMISKELSRSFLSSDKIKEILKEWMPQELSFFKGRLPQFSKKTGIKLTRIQHQLLILLTGYIQANFMNIYQLARFFKIFSESDEKPSGQYNIISYSGDHHSDFFRFALEKLDFSTRFSIKEDKDKRCLNMRNHVLDFSD